MTFHILTLAKIFENLDSLDWDALILFEGEHPFTNATRCILMGQDEENREEKIDDLFDKGFFHDLDVQTLKGIKINAEIYLEEVTLEQLLIATNYYYKNDTFYDFSQDQ